MTRPGFAVVLVGMVLGFVSGCGVDPNPGTSQPGSTAASTTADAVAPNNHDDSSSQFPDVIDAQAIYDDNQTWTFSATLSSPYDSEERYADAWRVMGKDGTVYGVRELLHHHGNEQPFTRSQSGVHIPAEVAQVIIQGRDLVNGWGGATTTIDLVRQ